MSEDGYQFDYSPVRQRECLEIPPDLNEFYRNNAYVCPCCRGIFDPTWAGMPGAFRAHIRDFRQGLGCFVKPSTRPMAGGRVAAAAKDF